MPMNYFSSVLSAALVLVVSNPALLQAQAILLDWDQNWDFLNPTRGALPRDSAVLAVPAAAWEEFGKSWRRRCLDPRFTRSLGSGVVLSDRVVNGAHRRRSSPHAASRPPAPAVRPSAVGPTGRGLSRRAVAAGGEEALHCRSQDTADELDPEAIPVLVDEPDHLGQGRSSSFAKNTLAALRISFAAV